VIIANLSDGATRPFDLNDPEDRTVLEDLAATNRVRALSILQQGVQHALPAPKRLLPVLFGAELVFRDSGPAVGERVFCQAGTVRVSLTYFFGGSLVRCDVVKTGRQRFRPLRRR
jgi:hypothetical protein